MKWICIAVVACCVCMVHLSSQLEAQVRSTLSVLDLAIKRQAAKHVSATDDKVKRSRYHQLTECLPLDKLIEGDIGYVDFYVFEVLQVIDTNRLLLVSVEAPDFPLCLEGIDTKGFVDHQEIVLMSAVEVIPAMTYQTVAGSNKTISVLRLLTKNRIDELRKEQEIAKELALKAEFRTWISSDGKHKVEARFLKFEKGKVHIENPSGKVVELAPNKLSKGDRAYYREFVKKQNTIKKTPLPIEILEQDG